MSRRKTNIKVNRYNEIDKSSAPGKGKGDTLYLVFQCLNFICSNVLIIQQTEIFKNERLKKGFSFECEKCNYVHFDGGVLQLFDYSVDVLQKDVESFWETVDNGEFTISHNDYLEKAKYWKYCTLCLSLQPLRNFSKHNARKSKRQGECISCKNQYNSFKNQTRTAEQFAESAQKRRLYSELVENSKIDYLRIREKFNNHCFNCGLDLSEPDNESNLDHTLPIKYLWPINTENATLLCSDCNQNKSDNWPSIFYDEKKLRALSVITGIDYELLKGSATYNPKSIEKLKTKEIVDSIITNYAKYMDEIIKIRNRIYKDTNFDFFESTNIISHTWLEKANSKLK